LIPLPLTGLSAILFIYGILTANMLLCFSFITQIYPTWAQGTAIGFTNMIVMLSGGLAQHGIGWILDELQKQAFPLYPLENFRIALSVLPLCLLLAICLTLFMKPRINTRG